MYSLLCLHKLQRIKCENTQTFNNLLEAITFTGGSYWVNTATILFSSSPHLLNI